MRSLIPIQYRLTLVAFTVLLCAVAAPAAQTPTQVAPPPDLDAYVARVLKTFEVPGVAPLDMPIDLERPEVNNSCREKAD